MGCVGAVEEPSDPELREEPATVEGGVDIDAGACVADSRLLLGWDSVEEGVLPEAVEGAAHQADIVETIQAGMKTRSLINSSYSQGLLQVIHVSGLIGYLFG